MAEKTVRLADTTDVNRSWRRISTGKLSFLYTEEKIIPNYLKSPTGSCHDACKYGSKHEEEEESQIKPRRVSVSVSVPPLKRHNRSFSGTLNLDSPLRKKNKALTTKPTLNHDSVCGGSESDHAKKGKVRNFSRRVCVDVKKMNAERTEKKDVSLSETRLVDSTTKRKKKKTAGVSRGGRALSRSEKTVEHKRRLTALKLKSVAQTAAIALRRSTVNRKKTNAPAEPKKTAVSARRASMPPKRCSRFLKEKRDSSGLSVPLIKTRKRVDELVEEKTLYVIKMQTGNEIVESDQNQRCVMDSPIDDDRKSREESECIVTDESSQEEQEDGKSMKLRFKRGKTVDFGTQDNNSPRKLKFKRGKTVTGAKGTNFNNDQHKPRSLKVVLKHQEITGKKRDSRVLLYNNVIEETASKLVETRKSKVKALVGAFETVISLEEQNYSTTT